MEEICNQLLCSSRNSWRVLLSTFLLTNVKFSSHQNRWSLKSSRISGFILEFISNNFRIILEFFKNFFGVLLEFFWNLQTFQLEFLLEFNYLVDFVKYQFRILNWNQTMMTEYLEYEMLDYYSVMCCD